MKTAQEESFVAFVEARRIRLRRMTYAICGDWSRADDLLQTALLKLYRAWPRVERKESPERYVRQIIVRSTIDESRRPWRREVARDLPGLDRAAVPVGVGVEQRSELVEALQRLPEMQRKVVVLRHLYDLSVLETAMEMNISEGTVKSYSSRGLATLRGLMDGVDAS